MIANGSCPPATSSRRAASATALCSRRSLTKRRLPACNRWSASCAEIIDYHPCDSGPLSFFMTTRSLPVHQRRPPVVRSADRRRHHRRCRRSPSAAQEIRVTDPCERHVQHHTSYNTRRTCSRSKGTDDVEHGVRKEQRRDREPPGDTDGAGLGVRARPQQPNLDTGKQQRAIEDDMKPTGDAGPDRGSIRAVPLGESTRIEKLLYQVKGRCTERRPP